MKKETSLRKVIETLSAYDSQMNDARILSIHESVVDNKMNYKILIGDYNGAARTITIPLYEEFILTKEEAIKRHRMMWNWIAYETLKREEFVTKQEALEHFGWLSSEMFSRCWCCTYARKDGTCADCPIQWPGDTCTGLVGAEGLYDKWCYLRWCSDYKKAADLAYQIANLPEKK